MALQLDSQEFAHIQCVVRLNRLVLNSCTLSGGIKLLQANRDLTTLDITGCKLDVALMEQVASLAQVRELAIDDVVLAEGAWRMIGRMRGLRRCDIASCKGVTKEDVRALEALLPDCKFTTFGL